jgi:fucokinase
MLAAARPHVHGAALAGAGGGGFLALITREPDCPRALVDALAAAGAVVYRARVVYGQGMILTHEPDE